MCEIPKHAQLTCMSSWSEVLGVSAPIPSHPLHELKRAHLSLHHACMTDNDMLTHSLT